MNYQQPPPGHSQQVPGPQQQHQNPPQQQPLLPNPPQPLMNIAIYANYPHFGYGYLNVPPPIDRSSKNKRKKSKKLLNRNQNHDIIYELSFLMKLRNSPLAKTPPANLPVIPGVTFPKEFTANDSNDKKGNGCNHHKLQTVPNLTCHDTNASSLLGAASLFQKGITDDSKDENEKIPLEILEYLENIEQENQVLKEKLESLELESKSLKIKNQELEDVRLCKVCMEAEICFLFLPCWHMCSCENCAVNRDLKKCPICRVKIEQRKKVFLP